ncbi:hypothetical protein [Azospirillum rugosum]|uniref:Uncharacterized protein n=1 Tax=Azospirillum rugosum TaxID=416170 RepID=A0ABS4SRQ3_9PROT|nr:hypothetical protein [Azospirillum rugosum]MBP2295122.1 hypothetical protein [Azospirillum rugosum]MDQ0528496.1 hypothetical protein [Azospirillum rugosum]
MIVFSLALLGGAPSRAAQVTVERASDGRHDLVIRGAITSSDQCHAARVLVERTDIRRIVVNSPGGDAWAGTRLARVIAWSGLPVAVPRGAKAYSAAAVAVMGGAVRNLDGDVGFHAPFLVDRKIASGPAPLSPTALPRYSANARPLLAEVTAQTRAVLREGGMPAAMIERVMAAGPTDLWKPGNATLRQWASTSKPDRPALERLARTCASVVDSLR